MLFNSWQFLIFLPIVFVLYFVLPKKVRHYELLLASYFFYMFWNWQLVFLILGVTLVSYLSGLFIPKINRKAYRILLLVVTLVTSLGILVFFKYFDFMANSVVGIINMFNGSAKWDSLNLILPIGISFYTFQTLSYVIDVFKGKIEPEKDFSYYALYVSFFPQLVAGPIERPENLLPQLKNQDGVNADNLAEGCRLMLIGFIKKIVIADMIGIFVNNIFSNIADANGLVILVGTLLFSMQILCDFAGYSDIAKGVAKCFNIDLMKNFDHPYRSTSVKEFWGRWHISLSSWLRDYVYFPLGGSRVNMGRWVFNIFLVFLISGLWHGANYTFLIWGMMHFVLRVGERLIDRYIIKKTNKQDSFYSNKVLSKLRMVLTFILVSLTWIAFRSNNVTDMLNAYRLLFTGWNFSGAYFEVFSRYIPINVFNILIIAFAVILFNLIDYLPSLNKIVGTKGSLIRKSSYVVLSLVVIFCFIYLQSIDIESSFIYFQF